jgi:hypothetical protein
MNPHAGAIARESWEWVGVVDVDEGISRQHVEADTAGNRRIAAHAKFEPARYSMGQSRGKCPMPLQI